MADSRDAETHIVPPTSEDLAAAERVLQFLSRQPQHCTVRGTLEEAIFRKAGELLRGVNAVVRRDVRARDRGILDDTGIRRQRRESEDDNSDIQATSNRMPDLDRAKRCYICRQRYQQPHFHYDSLCPACAEFNWKKRHQVSDLSGRYALVTGGRVRLGFQTALQLLRSGAIVAVTTRFPHDALRRYGLERDFEKWRERLLVIPLDLRDVAGISSLVAALTERWSQLDILINNAAQTVRRPAAYYRPLVEFEGRAALKLADDVRGCLLDPSQASSTRRLPIEDVARSGMLSTLDASPLTPLSVALSQWVVLPEDADCDPQLFPLPLGKTEPDDLRTENSWTQRLSDVPAGELLEVHLINSVAPFLLLQQLEPLFLKGDRARNRFVVNVSAAEGRFSGGVAPGRHPHTNMAKAGLNMLTRTVAPDLAERRIFVTSVDPGWFTPQQPEEAARRLDEAGRSCPLDEVDAAARVCDPIHTGLHEREPAAGLLFKDYRIAAW
jgi:NAD(P)-dependent dehydrogenase (short-subunit alcohol dehydrogenase family)